MQYSWKTSDAHTEGPLLSAVKLLNNEGAGKKKGGGGKARGGKGGGRKNGRLVCEGDGRGEEQGERPVRRRGKRDVRTLAYDRSLPSQDLKKHGTSLSKGTIYIYYQIRLETLATEERVYTYYMHVQMYVHVQM